MFSSFFSHPPNHERQAISAAADPAVGACRGGRPTALSRAPAAGALAVVRVRACRGGGGAGRSGEASGGGDFCPSGRAPETVERGHADTRSIRVRTVSARPPGDGPRRRRDAGAVQRGGSRHAPGGGGAGGRHHRRVGGGGLRLQLEIAPARPGPAIQRPVLPRSALRFVPVLVPDGRPLRCRILLPDPPPRARSLRCGRLRGRSVPVLGGRDGRRHGRSGLPGNHGGRRAGVRVVPRIGLHADRFPARAHCRAPLPGWGDRRSDSPGAVRIDGVCAEPRRPDPARGLPEGAFAPAPAGPFGAVPAAVAGGGRGAGGAAGRLQPRAGARRVAGRRRCRVVIRPGAPLPVGRTSRSPEALRRTHALGQEAAVRALPALRRWLDKGGADGENGVFM